MPARTDRRDAIQNQRGAAALVFLLAALAHGFPREAVDRHREAALGRQVNNVADLKNGVLKMGGEDREVLFVNGTEAEEIGFWHVFRHGGPEVV